MTAIEERVAELERRVEALEAGAHRQAPRPPEGLVFTGFQPHERVQLGLRDAVSAAPSGASPLTTADADASGRAVFPFPTLEPAPYERVYVAIGASSGKTVERPIQA